ncbi:MAG: hypothetical protein ABR556_11070, partial [Pyrinomonadaceae bacterium]
RRLPERNTSLSLFWGIPLTLAIAAIWYVPVIWKHGWFFVDQFFIQHHFERYVTSKYHHPGPVYYYLVVFPLLCLPWTAFLIRGLHRAYRPAADVRLGGAINKLLVFSLAWFLFPVVFFSFSSSKLPGYILPILPAAALIVGEQLSRPGADSKNSIWATRATAAACLLFAIAAPVYGWLSGNLSHACALMVAVPVSLAGGFALLWPRRQLVSVKLIGGATCVALLVTLHCAAPKRADYESAKRLLQLADSRGYSRAAIYGLERSDRTPEFYAAGRVVYEPDGEPVMYTESAQVIAESHRRKEVILTFVPLGEVSKLTEWESVRTDVIGNNGRFAIVAVWAP